MAVERIARVERVVEHTPATRSLFLRVQASGQGTDPPFRFVAGQFISCLVPTAGVPLNRAYSLASDPTDPSYLELLVDRVPGGPGSTFLCGLTPGATLRFTGPWGTFVLDPPASRPPILVAHESGIAPLRPMLHELVRRGTSDVQLLYGTTHAVYAPELRALAGVTVDLVDPGTLLDEARRRFVDAAPGRERAVYLCAVGSLALALRDLFRGAGYPRRHVHYEKW